MPCRSLHLSERPSGLYQAEPFGNSFADSVSFRFPSWQSLGGVKTRPPHRLGGVRKPGTRCF
jgi:hypothetical protein